MSNLVKYISNILHLELCSSTVLPWGVVSLWWTKITSHAQISWITQCFLKMNLSTSKLCCSYTQRQKLHIWHVDNQNDTRVKHLPTNLLPYNSCADGEYTFPKHNSHLKTLMAGGSMMAKISIRIIHGRYFEIGAIGFLVYILLRAHKED